ncbi:MAG TPA: stage II sporulation protein M [Tissierellales bacterium]|nr:stage II sporulation protein M [Tissierellales bacterium]
MQYKIKNLFRRNFQDNFIIYFTIIVFLIAGIVIGSITIKVLNAEQKSEILNFFNSFFKSLDNKDYNNLQILKQSVLDNFKTIFVIWITGILIIGIPIIPMIVLLRGFALGFTVGFLVNEFGIKGFLFSLLAILPQNIFIIPGIIFVSSTGLILSLKQIRGGKTRRNKENTFQDIINYSITILTFSIVVFLGSLVEAYITPIFIKLLTDYFS